MLTKDELEQIGKVVEDKIEAKLELLRKEMQAGFQKIEHRLDIFEEVVVKHHTKLKQRVSKLEEHVGLPQPE